MSFYASLVKKSVSTIKNEISDYVFLEGHLSDHYAEIVPIIKYLSELKEEGEYIFDLNYLLYFLITNESHENIHVEVVLRTIIGKRMYQNGYIEEGLQFMQKDYCDDDYCIIKSKLLLCMHDFHAAYNILTALAKTEEIEKLIFICNIYLNKKVEGGGAYSDIYDIIVKVYYDIMSIKEYIEYINGRRDELHNEGIYFLLLDFSIRLKETKILSILKSYKRIELVKLSELLKEDILVLKMNINAMMASNRLYGKLSGDTIEIY